MLLQKMPEKQRKNEGKRCNLTVLWEKSFVSSETWKFAERDDTDVILIFPPNLRGLPNAKWRDR